MKKDKGSHTKQSAIMGKVVLDFSGPQANSSGLAWFQTIPHRKEKAPDDSPYKNEKQAALLRPIRTEEQHERVMAEIDKLAGFELTQEQADYLEALTLFAEKWEEENDEFETSNVGPLETLKFLMEQHGMNGSDLGRLLGQRQLGSTILRGDRALSKEHIRKLSEHFHVPANLFL